MATIKSYTDIEQSKKLAAILPIESADMHIIAEDVVDEDTGDIISIELTKLGAPSSSDFPCWSLASLLNIIQKATPYKMEDFGDRKVQLICILGDKPWELVINDFNNEVDICYEMILKLHELELM